MKSATLALIVLATSISSWSLTHVPANAIKSTKHYRESGVGNATGRSGSAHMTARTLLSKDGSATVEVTTGTLDSTATPPGSFRKVQFKALSPTGDPLSVQNFFPPTAKGYYSFASPLLHRAQQIQLQANITGIDGNRTDVVTVLETVKARPDVAVGNLSFPSSAFANQPVNISANILEMNGDAGATTTCLLAIDGNNVDQMRNVYVDAAGSVSCAFAYMFTTTGGHTVQVSATNVVPGDWDMDNNSNTGTIEITSPDTAEHSMASFTDTNGSFPIISTSTSKLWHLGTLLVDTSDTSGNTGRMQDSNTTFSSSGCAGSTKAVAWQFPVNVNYSESMDGTSVYSFADTGITGSSSSFPGNNAPLCGGVDATESIEIGSDSASDHWNFLMSHEYYDSGGNVLQTVQTFQSERFSGDITYFSYGFQCFYWSAPTNDCTSPADYYVWNSPGEQVYGTITPVGSTWVPSVAVVDAAGNTFSGSVSVPLSSTQHVSNIPNSCQSQGPDVNGYSTENCSSSNNNYTITEGSVNN